MATLTHGSTVNGRAGAPVGRRLFARLTSAWATHRARDETLRALHKLDARALQDLQISPCDFQAIADGTYQQ